MRLRTRGRRRGGTLAEGAIVITLFLLLVLGFIDVGLGMLYRQILCEAARHGARQAIVHGSKSSSPWGPSTYGPTAASTSDPIADSIRPVLGGMNPADVLITVEWLDGGNDEENRVRVTLDYTYQPTTGLVFNGTFSLRSASVLPIAH